MTNLRWPVVLFDLDGTLVDTVGLIVASFQHTWRVVLDRDLDGDEARSWIGRTLPDVFAPFGPELAERMREVYVAYNVEELPCQQRTYEGVPDLLAALRRAGAATGIVTAKRRQTAQLSLDVARLEGIDLLCTLTDTTLHKPDPAPLLLALNKLGRTPDEAVYIGDAVVDVGAAKAAGCASIAVTWGAGLYQSLADMHPDEIVGNAPALARALGLSL